jgi:hypothetical protein
MKRFPHLVASMLLLPFAGSGLQVVEAPPALLSAADTD